MSRQKIILILIVLIFTTTLFISKELEAQETITYPSTVKNVRKPLTYKDEKSDLIFYVESDGRHIAAIDNKGQVLWHKDPFVDSKLTPYRTDNPYIVYIGPAQAGTEFLKGKGTFIGITFNSSQFGVINTVTGEFLWLGQD